MAKEMDNVTSILVVDDEDDILTLMKEFWKETIFEQSVREIRKKY